MNSQSFSWHAEVTRGDTDGKCGVSLLLWNNQSCEAIALTKGFLSPWLKAEWGSGGPGCLMEGHSSWCLLLLCHDASANCSTGRALFLLVLQLTLDPLESKGAGKLFLLWDYIFLASDQVLIFLTTFMSLVLSRSLTFCQQ